jgi:6-methylsalicylate decarboxylase
LRGRVATPWLRYLQTMRIDTHHHIFPASYLATAKRMGRLADVVSSRPSLVDWTPAESLEAMDRFGVQTAIASISTPGVWWGDDAEGRQLARACNEYAAEMVRDYPGRYGFFASIPLPDVEGSLAELTYALDVLGANGVVLMTNYGDRWPGDPAFVPFFDEVGRRKTTVFFHPTVSNCCRGILPDVSPSMIEYPFDSTRAIVSLLCSGTFSRWPEIAWIFSHGGGALPMVADRIVRQTARPPFAERIPRGAAYELGKLRFDVAAATTPPALQALLHFAKLENILLGTDFPFGRMEDVFNGLNIAGLSAEKLAAIEGGNAHSLLNLQP